MPIGRDCGMVMGDGGGDGGGGTVSKGGGGGGAVIKGGGGGGVVIKGGGGALFEQAGVGRGAMIPDIARAVALVKPGIPSGGRVPNVVCKPGKVNGGVGVLGAVRWND